MTNDDFNKLAQLYGFAPSRALRELVEAVERMERDKVQKPYEFLAMLHTETMAELVETQKRMQAISGQWWPLFLYWLQIKLRLKDSCE